MLRSTVSVFAIACLLADGAKANPRSIPSPTFPGPFGVNIHFTQGKPGEVKALSAAYKVIRMDFAWGGIETVRGVYDFKQFDTLVRDMEAAGVRPLLIVDYGNNLYGPGPVRTPEQRKAYTAFAVAAMKHFKGHKIMWEFWNEPNGQGFWGNRPDPVEYAAMVNEAAPAMLKADPNATLLVGAFAGFPWDYIETVFRKGCLRWADAVTVHPYRSGFPETVDQDYQHMRRLIAQYSPHRDVPIISGEWGYSTNRKSGIPELRQAQYLVRQRLYNVRCGILTSIWYDWKEDGPDPDENEHHFGSTHQDFSPKPAYTAALTMTRTLNGYRFVRMLEDGPERYAMLLTNAKGESAIALWSVGTTSTYRLPAVPKRVIGMLGKPVLARRDTPIDGSPIYAMFGKDSTLDALASWSFARPNSVIAAGVPLKAVLTVRNAGTTRRTYVTNLSIDGGQVVPRAATMIVPPGRTASLPVAMRVWKRNPVTFVTVHLSSAGTKDTSRIPLIVANPVTVHPGGLVDGGRAVTIEAAGVRKAETLTVRTTDASGKPFGVARKVRVAPGSAAYDLIIPTRESAESGVLSGIRLLDADGREVASAPPMGFRPIIPLAASQPGLPPAGVAVHAEGDEKPGGSVSIATSLDSQHGKVAEIKAEFPEGWRYFVVTPEDTRIPANAVAIGMWVKGDACGDSIRARFIDAAGQTYQPTFGQIDWQGWRWITMPLNDPTVGSWGGPQDGVIHKPIKWDSVFLLDSALRTVHSADVQVGGFALITR